MPAARGSCTVFTRITVLVYIVPFTFAAVDEIHRASNLLRSFDGGAKQIDCRASGGWLNCTGSKLPFKTNETRIIWNVTEKSFINSEDFRDVNHLTELIITGKGLVSIESGTFEKMDSLVNLSVTSTEISEITRSVLRGLDSLERLDLSRNRFNKLSDVIPGLIELANLRYLSLADNQISNVTEDVVEIMASLSQVDLTNNPLWCDCGLKPLRPYILDYRNVSKRDVLFVKTDVCGGPVDKRNVTVAGFLVRIYKMHCSSVSELMFSVYFATTALLCAGFLCAIKFTFKRVHVYLNRQPKKDKWLEQKHVQEPGLQVKMPLLEKSTGFIGYD